MLPTSNNLISIHGRNENHNQTIQSPNENEELGANFEYKDEIPEGMEARMGGGPKMFPTNLHLLILRPRII